VKAAQLEAPVSGFAMQCVPSGSPVGGIFVQRPSARLHLRPVGQSLSWEQIGKQASVVGVAGAGGVSQVIEVASHARSAAHLAPSAHESAARPSAWQTPAFVQKPPTHSKSFEHAPPESTFGCRNDAHAATAEKWLTILRSEHEAAFRYLMQASTFVPS